MLMCIIPELLSSFVDQENIKQHYKNKLVGTVLNGYLSLRKLVVQRTKLIDETQDKLLELLEEMTTGTESETREFMAVCVETVRRYGLDDLRSPVFIFERLCSLIYPVCISQLIIWIFFLTLFCHIAVPLELSILFIVFLRLVICTREHRIK